MYKTIFRTLPYVEKKYRDRRTGAIQRTKFDSIGEPTGLLDCDGNEIYTGEKYLLKSYKYYNCEGPVLWNRHQNCYGIFYGLWYGNRNPLDSDCYGKFIRIPSDNGMRMELVHV